MSRKAVLECGKHDEIVEAALALFLSYGYEGTSIRMIQKKVGSEAGLFYYYFKNKDEVFEKAVDLFFENYKKSFCLITNEAHDNPKQALKRCFEYMQEEIVKFRTKCEGKLHWSVRRAIREHMVDVITPYIKEILEIYITNGAILQTDISLEVMAAYLAHGAGGIMLHEDSEIYKSHNEDVHKLVLRTIGLDLKTVDEDIEQNVQH